MEGSMPTLEAVLNEVDQFIESDKTYADAPHIIDVVLPLLCSYLPYWWSQGPDNVALTTGWVLLCTRIVHPKIPIIQIKLYVVFRNHVTMVTSEHMNGLLKNVLKLIKKNIGNDNAPWMTQIAGKSIEYDN